jgi:glyoxalase family protein
MRSVRGLHHITAIAGDPQENLDFYVGVLGMRLVKRSINQDVPDTYHLFYADGAGNPGTDITFFPWPNLGPKRDGIGLWNEVYLTVQPGSLDYWRERLETRGREAGAEPREIEERFGERVLPFTDPHGMSLALLEAPPYEDFLRSNWAESPVPEEHQILGLGGARLSERSAESTVRFFNRAFGFREIGREGEWTRYAVGEGKAGQFFDLRVLPEGRRGGWGVGAVHHVAWRTEDGDSQQEIRRQVASTGRPPTEIIDRFWFKSVYVMEPGGALCEVATDGPGFAVDEDPETLGERLVLPEWYEPQRARIEAVLPELRTPTGSAP